MTLTLRLIAVIVLSTGTSIAAATNSLRAGVMLPEVAISSASLPTDCANSPSRSLEDCTDTRRQNILNRLASLQEWRLDLALRSIDLAQEIYAPSARQDEIDDCARELKQVRFEQQYVQNSLDLLQQEYEAFNWTNELRKASFRFPILK